MINLCHNSYESYKTVRIDLKFITAEKIRCQIHGVTVLGFLFFLAAKLYHTKNPSVLNI